MVQYSTIIRLSAVFIFNSIQCICLSRFCQYLTGQLAWRASTTYTSIKSILLGFNTNFLVVLQVAVVLGSSQGRASDQDGSGSGAGVPNVLRFQNLKFPGQDNTNNTILTRKKT